MLRVVAALGIAWLAGACGQEPKAPERPWDWVLVYHLAYDNDLGRHADAVLGALEEGLPPAGVAVVALVDRPGPGGLERHVLTPGAHRIERLDAEASADPRVVRRLVEDAARELPAARYGLFLLGHGGAEGLGALDVLPGARGASWMALGELGAQLRASRAAGASFLDLVFLQQCGRAALGTWSAFAGSAEVVMASQAVVGAPNHYYGGMLATLSAHPSASGEDLARAVMGFESPGMFADYVAFRGASLGELPARVDDALAPVFARGDVRPAGSAGTAPPTVTFRYGDEVHVDLLQWLDALYRANEVDPARLHALRAWLGGEALVARRVSPVHARLGDGLCGVSVPLSSS